MYTDVYNYVDICIHGGIMDTKMVRLSPELMEFLKTVANYPGESYDKIIRRLIEQTWKCKIPELNKPDIPHNPS